MKRGDFKPLNLTPPTAALGYLGSSLPVFHSMLSALLGQNLSMKTPQGPPPTHMILIVMGQWKLPGSAARLHPTFLYAAPAPLAYCQAVPYLPVCRHTLHLSCKDLLQHIHVSFNSSMEMTPLYFTPRSLEQGF